MEKYRVVLSTVVDPLCAFDMKRVRYAAQCMRAGSRIDLEEAVQLREAVCQVIERASRYIEMSVALEGRSDESQGVDR